MTLIKIQRPLAKEAVPPLVLGALGSAGVMALYFLVPGFQPLELVLLLVVMGFVVAGYTQRIVRGVMTIALLYFATGTAATFYRSIAPYVGTIMQAWTILWKMAVATFSRTAIPEIDFNPSGEVNHHVLAVSFGLLAVIIWDVLEVIGRISFRDTHLPRLRILDNLGGVIVHLIIGALVASLLFNTLGYSYGQPRRVHNKALLRPIFNQVLYRHYTAQSFWFPEEPPPIYVYDLDLPRER